MKAWELNFVNCDPYPCRSVWRSRHQQDALSVCVGLALVALKGSDLEVGRLALYRSWGWTLGLGVLLGVGNELLELYVTQPLLVRLFHRWPDLSDLRPIVGHRSLLVLALLLTWTPAAFGEELVYGGYLMNRVADLFGGTRAAWTLSLS